MLECVALPFSRGSFWPRDWTQVSSIAGRFFTVWATRETDTGLLFLKHYMISCSGEFSKPNVKEEHGFDLQGPRTRLDWSPWEELAGWGLGACLHMCGCMLLSVVLNIIIQFSCSVMSYSLRPHGLQHARLPCSSPTPWACSNSCPLSRWCDPTISSSVISSSCLQSFPASGSFQMSQFFRIRQLKYWSFSFSISPSNAYSGLISFRINWFDLPIAQGTLKSLLQHHSSKASILWQSDFFMVQLSHPYMTTVKTMALTRRTFVSKVMPLL